MKKEKNMKRFSPSIILALSVLLLVVSYLLDKRNSSVFIDSVENKTPVVDTFYLLDTVAVYFPIECLCSDDIYSNFIGIPVSHINYWDSLRIENKFNIWGLNNNPFMMGEQKQRPSLMDSSSNGMAVYRNERRAFADLILWYDWNPPSETETIHEYLSRRNTTSN